MRFAGWEAEIRLAVEVLFPTWLLLRCLDRFGAESPHTRIEVIESVLEGTGEALLQGHADIAISPRIPPGFLGDPLMRFRGIPVANPGHPLHLLKRKLTLRDLRAYRHLIDRSIRRANPIVGRVGPRVVSEFRRRSTPVPGLAAWFPRTRSGQARRPKLKILPLTEASKLRRALSRRRPQAGPNVTPAPHARASARNSAPSPTSPRAARGGRKPRASA